MTGDDLAAQVQSLQEQVAQLQSLLRAAALGLERENSTLGEGLLQLSERVDQLAASHPAAGADHDADATTGADAAPGKPDGDLRPRAWVDYATAEEWRELATWVDWLHATYDLRANTGVPSCWPAHPGAAEELAALHAAWRQAADEARPVAKDVDGVKSRGAQADTSAMIYFHDRWLQPLLTRVMSLYRIGDCRQKHQGPINDSAGPGKKAATDPDLLQTAIGSRARIRPPSASATPREVDPGSEPSFDPELEPPFNPATGEVED